MTISDILINTEMVSKRVMMNARSRLRVILEAHQLQSDGLNKLIQNIFRTVAIKFTTLNPNAHNEVIALCEDNDTTFATR